MRPGRACLLALLAALPALAGCASPPAASFKDRRAEDHNRIGAEAFRRGDLAAAALHFERALEHARGLANFSQQVEALNNLGSVHETLGDADAALTWYDEAFALARSLEDAPARGLHAAAVNRARLRIARGEAAAAEESLSIAEDAAQALGTRAARASCQLLRAQLLRAAGDSDGALARARDAARLYEIASPDVEALAGKADAALVVGALLRERGQDVEAVMSFREAQDAAERISHRTLTALALESIAATLEDLGHLDDARLRYRAAYDVNRRIPHVERALRNVEALERVAQAAGRKDHLAESAALRDALNGGAAAGDEPP